MRTESNNTSQKKRSLPLSQTKLGKQLQAEDDDGFNSEIEEEDWEPPKLMTEDTFMTDDEFEDPFPEKTKKKAKKKLIPAIRPLQSRSNMGKALLTQEETANFQRKALQQMGLHLPTSPSTQDSTVVEEESPSKRTPKGDEVEWVLLKDTARGTFRRTTAELAISAPVSPIDALKVLPMAKEILTDTWPGLIEDKIKMAVSFSPGNTKFL